MAWSELFLLFLISHLVGDMLLQTNWQATYKHGGLGSDPVRRRALISHGITYTAAYIPVLISLVDDLGAGVVLVALAIGLPHTIQDDGRGVGAFMRTVKKIDVGDFPVVSLAVDQTFHFLALLAVAAAAAT